MELISMDTISQNEIDYLINNKNTGIEFEYAIFYLLNSIPNRNKFEINIINKHHLKDKIQEIISKTAKEQLNKELKNQFDEILEVYVGTQNDDIGPADIILKNSNSQILGLSVKYQNNCTHNISSKYFLTVESINQLKKHLYNSCEKYITEMTSNFGKPNNWFRKRKPSKETDAYIDKIRDRVIIDWNKKTVLDRKIILSRLVHANSPINFWVVKFINTKIGFELDINTKPITYLDPNYVELTKVATSYIGFKSKNVLFAKMQVKFNNGILEKSKGKKCDFTLDGCSIKIGDPFGSWNFSI